MTPSKSLSPYEQLSPLPTPCFKMFLENPLMTPTPTTPLQATFTATPSPIHHPFPHKNFDHTSWSSTIVKIATKSEHKVLFLTPQSGQETSL